MTAPIASPAVLDAFPLETIGVTYDGLAWQATSSRDGVLDWTNAQDGYEFPRTSAQLLTLGPFRVVHTPAPFAAPVAGADKLYVAGAHLAEVDAGEQGVFLAAYLDALHTQLDGGTGPVGLGEGVVRATLEDGLEDGQAATAADLLTRIAHAVRAAGNPGATLNAPTSPAP